MWFQGVFVIVILVEGKSVFHSNLSFSFITHFLSNTHPHTHLNLIYLKANKQKDKTEMIVAANARYTNKVGSCY